MDEGLIVPAGSPQAHSCLPSNPMVRGGGNVMVLVSHSNIQLPYLSFGRHLVQRILSLLLPLVSTLTNTTSSPLNLA